MRAAAVVVALVVVLIGQGAIGPVPTAHTPAPRIDYVALGDSFSAGPLVPAQELAAGLCLRSTHDYPALLAGLLDAHSFVDVTCSGADTGDLSRSVPSQLPGPAPPPQLDALGPGTDLVTLGIGGNDFGLFGSMLRRCALLAREDPLGSPCRAAFTVAGVDTMARDAARVRDDVVAVLEAIRGRAAHAEVWVVGYPRILPDRGTCPAVPFARGDYRWADRVERLLNRSLRSAAASAGAGYADLYAASRGHDACAGDAAWVNGAQEQLGRAAAYHPLAEGMAGAAAAIRRQLVAESRLPLPLLSP